MKYFLRRESWIYLKYKEFNHYCLRDSAITSDSNYLWEYALKKRDYLKTKLGNDSKEKILQHTELTLLWKFSTEKEIFYFKKLLKLFGEYVLHTLLYFKNFLLQNLL